MNLRIRDHFLHFFHRGLHLAGGIHPARLEDIRREGFKKILVTATTAIGDAVLCTPLLQSIRKACPGAKIGFWVPAGALPLFQGQPYVDAVFPYHGKYRRVGEAKAALRQGGYDLALVANANDPDVIPLIWWSGCRRIIRRPQRYTIYHFMIANPEMLSRSHTTGHAIERNLEFCDLIGLPRGEARTRLVVGEELKKRADDLTRSIPAPWWVIHPGSSRSRKQWGSERYAELARRMLKQGKGTLFLTGNDAEVGACMEIENRLEDASRVRNFAGRLGLDELMAVFQSADLLISGDTGPYHIAMAVGTPTVTLFAPWDQGSSPSINGPYFDPEKHRVVETASMGASITTLSVDQVHEAVKSFLK